jgi:hypothetical protein
LTASLTSVNQVRDGGREVVQQNGLSLKRKKLQLETTTIVLCQEQTPPTNSVWKEIPLITASSWHQQTVNWQKRTFPVF